MLRATLRTAAAHKGRLILSTIGIVLGVAFVTGSFILTNALDRTFTSIIEGAAQDVRVTPVSAVDGGSRGPVSRLTLPDELVGQINSLPGVSAAAGSINQNGAFLVDAQGDLVGAAGPPALGINWQPNPELSQTRIVQGRPPEQNDEVAVDEPTFDNLGIGVGELLTVITPDGPVETTLVGVFRFGETGGLAGVTLTAFSASQAQELFAEPGRWNTIDVAVAPGFTDAQVADEIQTLTDGSVSIETRAEQVQVQSAALQEGLAFVTYVIVGFAAVSLLVAAFLIYNTFAMLVTQRGRELALLRAVGATRGQILRSILLEAAVVGTLAAVIGVGFGLLLANGLAALFGTFGLNLTSGIDLTTESVLLAALVGIGVTLLAALIPAYRGGRTLPVSAIRDNVADRSRLSRTRIVAAFLVLGLAVFLINRGLGIADEAARIQQTAIGLVVVVVAVILLAPALGVGLIALATPLLQGGSNATGRLAARNAARSPGRLATTASALTIGVALVVAATVVTSSARASLEQLVDDTFGAEYVVASITGRGFDPTLAQSLRAVPGVEYAVSVSGGRVLIDGEQERAVAVGGGPLDAIYAVEPASGSFSELGERDFVIDQESADAAGWQVGDKLPITYPDGSEGNYRLVGTYVGSELLNGAILNLTDFRANGGESTDRTVFIAAEPGVESGALIPALELLIAEDPFLEVLDQTAIKDQNGEQLNQVLLIIYSLLGLSVVIAALGVLNTLVLAVLERTREIGLLRAVGATQRQIRRMIRLEAIIVSILGVALGIMVGLVGGVVLQRALTQTGVAELVIPTGTVIAVLVGAFVIGIVAAVLPARRASRLNMLRAIATD
ncbi:MAG: FtsX-like permease family protein [Actinomycetia bacterium]|nr:FtsX-like permease family protein [Actinomycetes bacterium]